MKIARPIIVNDSMLASSNITETDYTPWSASVTYVTGDRVMLIDADVHLIYESAQNANTNHTPAVGANVPTWWLLVGHTNRWRMFDQEVTNQAWALNEMTVTLVPGGRYDTLVLLNVNAATVTITQSSAMDGVVYNPGPVNLVSSSAIRNWYDYFFEPVVRVTDYAVTNLLPYADSALTVTLDSPGGEVLLGEMVIGLSRDIGDTQYGASVGIQDYSVKQVDAFGNALIVERAYAKRGDFVVWIDPEMVSELENLLAEYRATAALYIASDSYSSTFIYGFYKDFSIIIQYPSFSVCNISVEGLA